MSNPQIDDYPQATVAAFRLRIGHDDNISTASWENIKRIYQKMKLPQFPNEMQRCCDLLIDLPQQLPILNAIAEAARMGSMRYEIQIYGPSFLDYSSKTPSEQET